MPHKSLPKFHLTIKDKTLLSLMVLPALFCLFLGIYYWVRLVGVFAGDTWRFDLMPWYWRVMACSLAVIYPIAACGLWSVSRWGIILWLAGAIYEFCAYTFYASYFGYNFWILILHAVFLGFYLILAYLLWSNKKEQVQVAVEY